MLNQQRVYAIIGAAGAGRRMGAPLPKQFLPLGGQTILERTADRFLASSIVDAVYITVPEAYMDCCRELFASQISGGRLSLIKGGPSRQDSVGKALTAIETLTPAADDLVLVHDGVRPYASEELIERVAEAARLHGAAVPCVPPKDTIRHETEGTLDRSRLYCVQTPQGFAWSVIWNAYRQAAEDGFLGTDDAGLAERIGQRVELVEGESANIKITLPEDLPMEQRIGTGYDVHQLTENRKLILGGEEIPYEKGLLGHSDADVLIHALMDAMLGAAALGDIGKLFPDSDDAYKGISSLELLRRVRERLSQEGYSLGNADVTVICQRPKLASYIDAMRENLAEALQTEKDRISIKATTTERLGFCGRGEGIAAQAVCILNRY